MKTTEEFDGEELGKLWYARLWHSGSNEGRQRRAYLILAAADKVRNGPEQSCFECDFLERRALASVESVPGAIATRVASGFS